MGSGVLWESGLVAGLALLLGWLISSSTPLHTGEYISLGDAGRLHARGFYDAEVTPAGRGFRWTDGYSRLVFATQGRGTQVLFLAGTAPHPTRTTVPVTLTVNQALTIEIIFAAQPRRYNLLVPPAAAALSTNGVDIHSATFTAEQGADRRKLGVVLFEAGWATLQPQHWLVFLQVLMLTTSSGLLTLALAGERLRWRVAVVGTLVMLALVGYGQPHLSMRWHAALLTPLLALVLYLTVAYARLHEQAGLARYLLPSGLFAVALALCVLVASWYSPLVLLPVGGVLLVIIGGRSQHDVGAWRGLWAWLSRAVVPLCALVLLATYLTLYVNCSYARCAFTIYRHPPIHGDGVGYYAYLPAILLDGDLTMETLMRRSDIQPSHGISRFAATGHYLNKYPMGVAVLLLPFFLVGHGLTLLLGYPADGWSPLYQLMVGLAAPCYTILGLWLLQRALLRSFVPAVVAGTLVCILFGTNLFHYATFDVTMSHAFSFCLLAALLLLLPRWYRQPDYHITVLLALVCGLLVLVRNPNGIVWLFVPLWGITRREHITQRLHFFRTHYQHVALLVALIASVLTPQLLYWHAITGQWLLNSYRSEGFAYYLEPGIGAALFGIQRGLFIWSPVLLFCLPGLWYLRRQAPEYMLPLLLYLPLLTYIVASWHDPGYGAAYGLRPFVDSLAALAWPLAACFAALRGVRVRRVVVVLAVLLVLFSLLQTSRYWQGAVDAYAPTWDEYRAFY